MKKFKHLHLFLVILLAFLFRLIPAFFAPAVGDMANSKEVAQVVLSGQNAYTQTQMAPNPPPWLYQQAGALWLSRFTGLPHSFLVKIPSILADLGICFLLYRLFLKKGKKNAILATAFWAFNPLSILVTAFQGQFDSQPLFFILLALFFFPRRPKFSSLFLGIAIVLKLFPLLLLPFFLLFLPRFRQKLLFALLALAPTIAALTPFFLSSPTGLYQNIVSYSGFADHGWLAIFRLVFWFKQGLAHLPYPPLPFLLSWGKIFFLVLYTAFVYFVYRRRPSPPRLPLLISLCFLLFLVIYAGIASQYLLWPLPFLFLVNFKKGLVYSLLATFSLLSFYTLFYPALLLFFLPPFFTKLAFSYSASPNILAPANTGLPLSGLPAFLFLFHLIALLGFWLYSLKLVYYQCQKNLFPKLP